MKDRPVARCDTKGLALKGQLAYLTPMLIRTEDPDRRAVALWLFAMAGLVFLMVVVGGATRLTESGLSMVDWRPVTGVLPPLSEEAWQAEFEQYQDSPEYRLKNAGMSLDAFKGIFYWEWGHRVLGRIIGLAFFVPLVFFWVRRRIPDGYKGRLVFLFLLGGSQGLLGWYMVQSGLVDEPAVSHYRLAAHLSLALIIFSALLWTALSLWFVRTPQGQKNNTRFLSYAASGLLVLTALQIVMGALVAGLKAGHIYNTWPLMGDSFVPAGLLAMDPWWQNMLDNAVTVQFDHRIGAYILSLCGLIIAGLAWRMGSGMRRAGLLVIGALCLQMVIGIIMLLEFVPVGWGTLHQGGGVVVLVAVLWLLFVTRGQYNQAA